MDLEQSVAMLVAKESHITGFGMLVNTSPRALPVYQVRCDSIQKWPNHPRVDLEQSVPMLVAKELHNWVSQVPGNTSCHAVPSLMRFPSKMAESSQGGLRTIGCHTGC